ncbi:hypothetical protein [Streptomyces sp. NPDC058613]
MEWMETVRELAEDPLVRGGGGRPGDRPACAARARAGVRAQ